MRLYPRVAVVFLSLLLLSAGVGHAGRAGGGRSIFRSRGCNTCHRTKRPSKAPTIEARLREKGPDLWYAGSRFRKSFLERWLAKPEPIRPMAYNSLTKRNSGRHPRLGPAEARKVASYLMTLRSPDVKPAGIKPKRTGRGRFVFTKKLGCYGCHLVKRGRKVVGGLTGPTLIGASKRLTADWIYAYLKNPEKFTPVSPMPFYRGLVSEKDLKTLAAFVAAMK